MLKVEDSKISKESLIVFEKEIASLFENGKIFAPVHLSDGNEDQLIDIFKDIKKTDWVFSTWRSHYHALLHGIPKDKLKEEIIKGNSITLCFPEYKFYTSAIVGGIVPIAMGVAYSIKMKNEKDHVWCFVGDMTAETGIFMETTKYAFWNKLPITFVVEDNGYSVGTPTDKSWGKYKNKDSPNNIRVYSYKKTWPHVGSGKWTTFIWLSFIFVNFFFQKL